MLLGLRMFSILMAGRSVQQLPNRALTNRALTNRAVAAYGQFSVNPGWRRYGSAMVSSIAVGRHVLRQAKRICRVGETDPPRAQATMSAMLSLETW
jgi:hypothetical protein